ncbi:hypothetical protein BU23DRAFT_492508, partial [Bimuria novae-zelandiae CBS 107.79]
EVLDASLINNFKDIHLGHLHNKLYFICRYYYKYRYINTSIKIYKITLLILLT